MKYLAAALPLLIAACGQATPEAGSPDPIAGDDAGPLASAPHPVAPGASIPSPEPSEQQPMGPGLYDVGSGPGALARVDISPDGGFTNLGPDGAVVGQGTWKSTGNVICFDLEGDGEGLEERCWRNGKPGEDGTFLSRRVGGPEHYLVIPVDEPGAPII
ncbi:MAG: hypothetical protein V2I27_07095 [Erythrobacter sp.]|jgi:hypothetical protein|nr:hypothetical protein [Erythrobacter sp.]